MTIIRGGKKLDAFLRKAKVAKNVRSIQVGFFQTDTYPDGTPVTNVALWQEFGTEIETLTGTQQHIPERPFFRNAIRDAQRELPQVLHDNVDPRTMVVDRKVAEKLGLAFQGLIYDSITRLTEPPNAPSTKRIKKSENPLLDEGTLRGATTYRIT